MPQTDEDRAMEKAEAILEHLREGGSIKSVAGFSDEGLEAVYAVAHNFASARKFDKAVDLLKFLCLCDHMEPRWAYALGVVEQQRGDFAAAINAYGLAAILDVDDPRPQAQAGYCLMAKGEWEKAVAAFEGALQTIAENAAGQDPSLRSQVENLLEKARANLAKKAI